MDLSKATAVKLKEMLKNKECSALEIVKTVFKQIEKKESQINAFLTLTEEQAIEKAKLIDKKIAKGEVIGTLVGIPIAIKDNICTKGIKTTAASKILENFIPQYNATVIEKLNGADAIIIGKTNLDEFAMGSSGETSYFKKTRNPCNLEYVPGGSSSGSAAAVAADETILALGSDTGGSIRVPASFCGVVGMCPTYGRVSRYGLIPLASSFDRIGPIAKTVEDVELMFKVIAGLDLKDSTTVKAEEKSKNFNIKSLKIGVPKEYFNEHIDSEVSELVFKAIETYKQNGAQVVELSMPHMDYLLPIYYVILTIEAASNLAKYDGVRFGFRASNFKDIEEMYEKTREEGFGEEVKRRIILGTFLSSSEYGSNYIERAVSAKEKLTKIYNEAFSKCDVLITPTSATPAFKFNEVCDPIKMYAADLCTLGSNIVNLPSISIPCGNAKNGMPVGMQIIGRSFDEFTLFEVGKFYEKILK